MKIQITFRGGAQIEFEADTFETARNGRTNALERVTLDTPEDWTAKLHGLYDLAEVVAIVTLRDSTEAATTQADTTGQPE